MTLRFLWNYARGHTAAQCRTVLENYVVHGGDEGLTRIAVRTSCGLAVEEEEAADRVQQVLAALTVEGARPAEKADELARARQAKKAEQQKISEEIKTWLQNDGKDWFTAAQAKVAKSSVVFSFSRGEAANVLQELARDGYLPYLLSQTRDLPKVGRSTIYIPRIVTKKTLADVVPMQPDDNITCVEEYNWSSMRSRMSPGSSRMLNLRTIAEAYRHKPIGVARGARPTRKRPRTIAMPSSPRNS